MFQLHNPCDGESARIESNSWNFAAIAIYNRLYCSERIPERIRSLISVVSTSIFTIPLQGHNPSSSTEV